MFTHGVRRAPRSVASLVLTALVALALSSCAPSSQPGQAATGQSAPQVAGGETLDRTLPAAAANARLVDQDGDTVTLRSLRGKVVVLAPLLTLCQETCPMTSQNMHRAATWAESSDLNGQIAFVEATVDPARDSVKRLHAYQKLYGALPDWTLATGKPAAVKAMWRALGVALTKVPVHDKARDWMTGKLLEHPYDVQHQDVVFVIDPQGSIRWMAVGRPDARDGTVPTPLGKFLNDEGRQNLHHPGAGGASTWSARQVEQAVRYVRGLGSGG